MERSALNEPTDSGSESSGTRTVNRFRLADSTLDIGQRRLRRATKDIRLSRLSFECLALLVKAAPNLVMHEELATKV